MDSTKKSSAATEGKDESSDSWNPMEAEYRSVLNSGFASNYLTSALMVGGINAEGEYRSISEVLCEFDNGTGACWKGRGCLKSHSMRGDPINTTPAVLNTPTYHVKSLPSMMKTSKREIHFSATVVYVDSPFQFFIIPKDGFHCACGCGVTHQTYHGAPEVLRGYKGLEYFRNTLSQFMDAKYRRFQLPQYQTHQLVVVKSQQAFGINTDETRKYYWYRAVVENNCSYNKDNPYEIVQVFLKLLDFGAKIVVPFDAIASMPQRFVNISPLAYKCMLHDIHPVGPHFSSKATERFRTMVLNQDVVVVVRSGPTEPVKICNPDDEKCSDFELIYSVDLVLQLGQIHIADQLSKLGLGLRVHPFPYRPMLLQHHKMSFAGASLLSNNKGINEKEIETAVLTEKRRLFEKVTREDGYFETRFTTYDSSQRIYLQFPENFCDGGIYVPCTEIELAESTTPLGEVIQKYNELQQEDRSYYVTGYGTEENNTPAVRIEEWVSSVSKTYGSGSEEHERTSLSDLDISLLTLT